MTPVVALEEVVREYPIGGRKQRVLDRVTLELAPGDFVAVTGPSGSGKSTLLNLCALLDLPDAGRVELGGVDVATLGDEALSRLRGGFVGMIFQSFALLPYRTALENVSFRFRYVGSSGPERDRARALSCLEQVGLAAVAERPAHLLSGGEMQRLAIARAVALEPRVLIADEPTGNLDDANTVRIMECLCQLNLERGITVLLATHDLDLLAWSTRHLVCRGGRLEEAT